MLKWIKAKWRWLAVAVAVGLAIIFGRRKPKQVSWSEKALDSMAERSKEIEAAWQRQMDDLAKRQEQLRAEHEALQKERAKILAEAREELDKSKQSAADAAGAEFDAQDAANKARWGR